jgi:hypothetical protein
MKKFLILPWLQAIFNGIKTFQILSPKLHAKFF